MSGTTSSFRPNLDELEKMLDRVIADEGEVEVEAASVVDELGARECVVAQLAATAIEVSEDGLSAYISGVLPADFDLQSTIDLLRSAGVNYGIQEEVILDALAARTPYKSRNARRRIVRAPAAKRRWEVARGTQPQDAQPGQLEWGVPLAEDGGQLQTLLRGNDLGAIERYRTGLPLVRPGQILARLRQELGQPGVDVRGRPIPCAPAPPRHLPIGEYVEADAEGRCCRATICGYAVLCNGEISVIPPIWIAPDNMRVYFVRLPYAEGTVAPTSEDVSVLLDYFYIEKRDEAAQKTLCADFGKGETARARLSLLARGRAPVPGMPATWEFTFPPKHMFYSEQIAFLLRASRHIDDVRAGVKGLASRCVSAGEVIAHRVEMRPGVAGFDVFGEVLEPEQGAEFKIDVGHGASVSEDGLSCRADVFGYVCLSGNEVRVITPLWVSSDAMEAYYTNFQHLGGRRVPHPEDIAHMLKQAGVRCGINEEAIQLLCEKMRQGLPTAALVRLARGEAAAKGFDAQIHFAVDTERKAGELREDGSIDFKAGQSAPQVGKGQVLATLQPATRGAQGRDLFGRDIPSAGDGRALQVDAGRNVLHERDEEGISTYRAQIDGELHVEERGDIVHMAVSPVLVIHGDVDYSTGNVEFEGSVRVTGVVKSGFSVRATDDIVIGDYIDDKGFVCAGGKVAVLHGVTGEGAHVQAGGSVQAKFINSARVECRGDLLIDEYIYNARVHCGGSIAVRGHYGARKTGAIIGGIVVAARAIRAVSIGSDTGAGTTVVAGVDMEVLTELRRQEVRISKSHEAVRQLKRHLGMESLNPRDIRNMILRLSGDHKKRVGRLVEKMATVLKQQSEAEERKKECQAQMAQVARGARIAVGRQIASNTKVRLGELSPRAGLFDGLEGFSLYVRNDNGRPRVDIEALGS